MCTGGDDDAVCADLLTRGGAHTLRAGEVNVFGDDGDVRLSIAAAVVATAGFDGVDAREDAVLESCPIDLRLCGGEVVAVGLRGLLGQSGRVDEHLRRYAADVEAGAPEMPFLGDGRLQSLESLVEEHVPRSGADEQQVVVRQDPTLQWSVFRPVRSRGEEAKGRHG